MATSRYNVSAANTPRDSITSGSQTGSQTSAGSQTSNSTTTTSGTTDSSSTTQNLDAKGLAALNQLIAQLQGGGTPEMRQQQAVRDAEIASVRGIRNDYSKDAAFNDAQGLIALQMRRTMEQLLPSINRAAEDAGSSGGALRALLLQDTAQKTAESSSAAGMTAAVQYGGISSNLSSVLEGLTRSNPAATEALLQALGIAKGATVTSTGRQSTNQTSNTSGQVNTSNVTNSQQNSNETRDYAPFAVSQPRDTSPIYFGPAAVGPASVDQLSNNSTLRALSEITAGSNSWSGYTF